MSGPGQRRAERLRERGLDTTATFCDKAGQPDPACSCGACVRYFDALERRTVRSNDLSSAAS